MKRTSSRIFPYSPGNAFAIATQTLALCSLLLCFPLPSHAAITPTGDVDPADPSTWQSGTHGYIGKTGDGSLEINDGSDVSSYKGYIGNDSGSMGQSSSMGMARRGRTVSSSLSAA